MPPPTMGWTQCDKNYCGQYFQTDIAQRGHPAVCPNCTTQYLCEESADPPEPPEPEMLMLLSGSTGSIATKGKKKTK